MSNESIDKLLDLLVDALEERMASRAAAVKQTPVASDKEQVITDRSPTEGEANRPIITPTAPQPQPVSKEATPTQYAPVSKATKQPDAITSEAAVTTKSANSPDVAAKKPAVANESEQHANGATVVAQTAAQQGVRLPHKWQPYFGALKIEHAEELRPEMVASIIRTNRKLLRLLTPKMIMAMPPETFSALPDYVLKKYGPLFHEELNRRKTTAKLAKQQKTKLTPARAPVEQETLLPLRWTSIAKQYGVRSVEELQPDMVATVLGTNPGLMRLLTRKMLGVLPAETLAVVPDDYLEWHGAAFDDELSQRAKERDNRPKPAPNNSEPNQTAPTENELDTTLAIDDTQETPIIKIAPQQVAVSDNMPKTLGRIVVVLFACILLANIRLDISFMSNLIGSNLVDNEQVARNSTIAMLEGSLIQESSTKEIYLVENGKRRWITTPQAFEASGYRWGAVRFVPGEMLDRFDEGEPINLLLKCPNSPHVFVYGLQEPGSRVRIKRYIKDIATFSEQGFKWEDVNEGYCTELRNAKHGDPIPEDYTGRGPDY